MPLSDIPTEIHEKYEIYEWRHATAILAKDFPTEFDDLLSVLANFKLRHGAISKGGKNKSDVSGEIDWLFNRRGWTKKQFDTEIHVDQTVIESPTHEVDEFKNGIAVETEWNNKDPFYDRDLNNFRLLFELRTVSVGIVITRCDELQDIFDELGRGDSYGESTTHMRKLLRKIEGGGGGGCPLVAIGIRKCLYDKDDPGIKIPTVTEIKRAQAKEKAEAKAHARAQAKAVKDAEAKAKAEARAHAKAIAGTEAKVRGNANPRAKKAK